MKNDYGFVYIWFDKRKKRYYIGSHWGTEDDGYICSSDWMLNAKKRRPEDFKRRVISKIYTNRQDLFLKEQEWINLIKPEEIGKRYYNLQLRVHHWAQYPDRIKTIGEKISIANQGREVWNKGLVGAQVAWNKGKEWNEETREKMSKIKKGCKFPNRKKIKLSEEHKQNIAKSLKKTLAEKNPIENRYIPEFERGSKEWKEKISKTASQYIWITDETTDKRVLKETEIPKGWRKGRNSSWRTTKV